MGSKIVKLVLFFLIVIGGITYFGMVKGPASRTVGSLTPAAAYFIEATEQKLTAELGQTIDGFLPVEILNVYPGLKAEDFDGVEAAQGVYSIENDAVVIIENSELIHPTGNTITPYIGGMGRLLENIAERLDIPIATKEDIDAILGVLEGRSDGNADMFFPVQSNPTAEHMEALITGVLEEKDECLRIDDALIVWPHGSKLEGNRVVHWNENLRVNRLVATITEAVTLGGGMIGEDHANRSDVNVTLQLISNQLPSDKCAGPFWIVGQYEW